MSPLSANDPQCYGRLPCEGSVSKRHRDPCIEAAERGVKGNRVLPTASSITADGNRDIFTVVHDLFATARLVDEQAGIGSERRCKLAVDKIMPRRRSFPLWFTIQAVAVTADGPAKLPYLRYL